MCLDPHAVAVIKAREALEQLEVFVQRFDDGADNGALKASLLGRIHVLRKRIEWCYMSYSRQRSVLLFQWIVRAVSEVVMEILKALNCLLSAAVMPRCTYDARSNDPLPATVRGTFAGRARIQGRHFSSLPLATRERPSRGQCIAAAGARVAARGAGGAPLRNRVGWRQYAGGA